MRRFFLVFFLLVPRLALAQGEAASAIASGKVLVLQLDAVEVAAAVATHATDYVADGIAAHAGMKVITRADADAMLGAQQMQQLIGCGNDANCLTTSSRALQADYVVRGTVGMVGMELIINLSLTEAKTSTLHNRASAVGLHVDELRKEVVALVNELFGWQGTGGGATFVLNPARPRSFAVLDLQAAGIEASTVQGLTPILAEELKKIDGASVIGKDDIVTLLKFESDKQLLGCADTSCLAEIGGALGVSWLVVGSVGKVADSTVISLRLLDPQRAEVENRVSEAFSGESQQIFGALRVAVRRLIGLHDERPGALALSATEEKAKVFVDGAEKGALPLAALTDLSPGRHSVRLVKEDFLEWQSDVYVEPGASSDLRARLTPVPTAWYQSWILWTAAGGVVAAAVGATIAGVVLSQSAPTSGPFEGMNVGLPR